MSAGEHDTNGLSDHVSEGSVKTFGTRAASPAKRNAAEMEGTTQDEAAGQSTTATNIASLQEEPTDVDDAVAGMTPASNSMDTQDTVSNSLATSFIGVASANTSATSLQSQTQTTPSSLGDEPHSARKEPYSTGEIDEQVKYVRELANKPLDEGQLGVLISRKWLSRVFSRTSMGLKSSEYPKESREGDIGPVDNSDIVPDNAFNGPVLYDNEKQPYIPLKPGLAIEQDFQIIPKEAYGYVIGQYGYTQKHPIVRYVHDTAPEGASGSNLQFELYPPVIVIQIVAQSPSTQQAPKFNTSTDKLRLKREREARGQKSPVDAIHLVSSRSERFQKFLARSKEAAGIPRATKVRLWRMLDPTTISIDKPNNTQSGVSSPPASRDPSPSVGESSPEPKLILDHAVFNSMEVGKDLEPIDARDETNNDKYNGKSTMDIVGLVQDQTILLEEQIGGPGGGEFQSDTKKGLSKLLGRRTAGSMPGSAPASGRTSPVPGMMTRGRARKDGRTRGTIGLTNLGNTCYMNSALQCIRSVEELAIYFLSQRYKAEINNDNPLGHHGVMAKSYAGVLQGIYGDSTSSAFTPSQFKKTISGIQPLFSGYGQQDSQEFLSFLVDALHEDLNRIIKKPYNENPDSDDKTVHDPEAIRALGEIYRKNHKARNDSIAMDLFNGFYKNTMECPVCEKISITFDPYSLLTVQLPMENTFQHTIAFIPLRGKPINHGLDIDKNATIKTVKEWIARRHPDVDANRLWMIEVYGHKPYKVFEDFSTIAESSIQANDHLFVFELDGVPKNRGTPKRQLHYGSMYSKSTDDTVPPEGMDSPKADCFAVPIFSRVRANVNSSTFSLTMHPLYISLTREEAKDFDIVLKKILIAVSRTTSRPILREFDEEDKQLKGRGDEAAALDADDENTAEDTAGVSDHSGQSEESYVKVSLGKSPPPTGSEILARSANAATDLESEGGIPPHFMDPEYFLSPALRHHLFEVKYHKNSGSGMHCVGFSSFADSQTRPMFDRVAPPARRSSTSSSMSDESNATSTASGRQGNEAEESDVDEMNNPDLVQGGDSELTPERVESSDDESLPENPLETSPRIPRGGRRRNHKKGRKNRQGRLKTYGGKKNQRNAQSYINSSPAEDKHGSDDNPYYIRLGEAIVLDWFPDAIDALYDGDPNSDDDMRGHRTTDDTGSTRAIPLYHDPELEAKKQEREKRRRHGITLEDCFAETGKREILSEDNAWYCNRCKEMRRAAKTLEIWTIPDILVVHLKRFGGTRSFRDKIEVMVDYPIEGLDMSERIGLRDDGKEYIYDLFAVDNHYGGLGGGHYTAMAKNFNDGQWYDYNDGSCSKLGSSPRLSAAAYLLFYRRRSDVPLGPPALQELVDAFRNPPTDAEEIDESGEDKLGGPTRSSLHGSSSASVVAGAEATNNNNRTLRNADGGPAGAALLVGNSRTPKPTTRMSDVGGSSDDEEVVPATRMYGAQGNGSWDFSRLDDDDVNHDVASRGLLSITHREHVDDDDNDSTRAEKNDDDNDSGYEDGGSHYFNNSDDMNAHANSPIEMDDHDVDDDGRPMDRPPLLDLSAVQDVQQMEGVEHTAEIRLDDADEL